MGEAIQRTALEISVEPVRLVHKVRTMPANPAAGMITPKRWPRHTARPTASAMTPACQALPCRRVDANRPAWRSLQLREKAHAARTRRLRFAMTPTTAAVIPPRARPTRRGFPLQPLHEGRAQEHPYEARHEGEPGREHGAEHALLAVIGSSIPASRWAPRNPTNTSTRGRVRLGKPEPLLLSPGDGQRYTSTACWPT